MKNKTGSHTGNQVNKVFQDGAKRYWEEGGDGEENLVNAGEDRFDKESQWSDEMKASMKCVNEQEARRRKQQVWLSLSRILLKVVTEGWVTAAQDPKDQGKRFCMSEFYYDQTYCSDKF